jgi:hypothetical protein
VVMMMMMMITATSGWWLHKICVRWVGEFMGM